MTGDVDYLADLHDRLAAQNELISSLICETKELKELISDQQPKLLFMTAQDYARYCGLDPDFIRGLCNTDHSFPAIKMGPRVWRVDVYLADEWFRGSIHRKQDTA